MAEVTLEGVSKRFGATSAVSDLSLTVDDGAFVVLLGPTGAGKTTTLRLVAGLEKPDAGRIRIAGQDVTSASPAQRDVAFVFQQYSLYPHLSVFDNLAFPLRSPARRVARTADPPEGERSRGAAADLRQAGGAGHETFRRSDAARGDRPRPGSLAFHLPDGRAAFVAGRQVARRIAHRAQAHPDGARRHDPLCHARPDGGDDARHPRRRHREWPPGAGRHATTSVRGPAERLRGRALGQPADQPRATRPRFPTSRCRKAQRRSAFAPNTPTSAKPMVERASGRVRWVEHLGDQDHLHVDLGERDFVTLADPNSGLGPGDEVAIALTDPLFFNAAGERVRA